LTFEAGARRLARLSALLESLLGDLFSNRISVRLMEHAAMLDLAQYEDAETYDHLERARRHQPRSCGAARNWCSRFGTDKPSVSDHRIRHRGRVDSAVGHIGRAGSTLRVSCTSQLALG